MRFVVLALAVLFALACGGAERASSGVSPSPDVPTQRRTRTAATRAAATLDAETSVPEETPSPAPADAPEPTPESAPPVEITEWTSYPSASGDYINIDGTVKNVSSDKTISSVKIFVQLRDAAGKLLANDYTYMDLDALAPGESSTWSIFAPRPAGFEKVEIVNLAWDEE